MELETWQYDFGSDVVDFESETHTGLSACGPSRLVHEFAATVAEIQRNHVRID